MSKGEKWRLRFQGLIVGIILTIVGVFIAYGTDVKPGQTLGQALNEIEVWRRHCSDGHCGRISEGGQYR